jgi:hypothetical protein
LGIRIETKLLPGKRVTIHSSPSGSTVDGSLFSNEGTGANQLPFILVPIGLTPPGETILLSEPEVHLHPRAQVHLTRLLVTLAKKENRQFFIETHSEHVLHGLLNAVATGALKQSDIAIYYFENKAGKAVCTRLRINETGAVEGGLPGFFDQSLGELAEYLEALKGKWIVKHKFLLDENILYFAINGVDENDAPDETSTILVTRIGLNCHTIVVSQFLLDRYWVHINQILRQGRRARALEPVVFINQLLKNSQKWAVEWSECPPLPGGVVVPAEDIAIVRLALLAGARIVTGDSDLRLAVNGSVALNLQAVTPSEALVFAADS